jgi:hypothetical protein
MRLTFAIAFAFAISSALVSASAGNLLHLSANIPLRSDAYPSPRTVQVASRAQPQKCGTGGKVLEQNTIDHKGNTITHVSGTCPDGIGGSGNPTKRSELEERQDVCTSGDCEGDPTYPPWGACLTSDD